MALITVDAGKCNHDGLCVQACPLGLIGMGADGLPVEIPDAAPACVRCGHCVAVCPTQALDNARMPMDDFEPVPQGRPTAEQLEALLVGRRSVRGFRKAPVHRETLERLLEVARRAPTASNTQHVSWIMVQDPGRLERIKTLCLDWMRTVPGRERYVSMGDAGRDVVLRGGTVLAVAHTPQDWGWCDSDCAIALTYMELHAATLGLGACWGGLVTRAAQSFPGFSELLELPVGQRVGGALMLGLPRQTHHLVPPRNPVRVTWL